MNTDSEWQQFEKRIKTIFEVKGCKVQHDIIKHGRQSDLWVDSPDENIGSILVECKYHQSDKCSVTDVENFIARVTNLRAQGEINSGYLVASTDFTNRAKEVLESNPLKKCIKLKTPNSLLAGLINFEPYLKAKYDDYLNDSIIMSQYEPLSAKSTISRNRLNLDKELLKKSRSSDETNVVIITGDYGVGKTTSLRHLHFHLLDKYFKSSNTERIPLYIDLKKFHDTGTVSSLILQFMSENLPFANAGWPAFVQMMKAESLTLILDGFDEMAKRTSPQYRRACFIKIAELCIPGSKVYISGRGNYFRDNTEFFDTAALLSDYSFQDSLRSLLAIGSKNKDYLQKPPMVEFIEICPLNLTQIKSFLKKRFNHHSKSKVNNKKLCELISKIETMYNLRELAERPILLEMIYSTLGSDLNKTINNVSDLYADYTNAWLQRESDKGDIRHLVSSEQRLIFTLNLAGYMLFETDMDSDSIMVHHSELTSFVQEMFELDQPDEIDSFSSDIQTCTFLERDEDGHYYFAHKSFFEYFSARYITCLCNLTDKDISRFIHDRIPENLTFKELESNNPGVTAFLDWILEQPISPSFWKKLEPIYFDAADDLAELFKYEHSESHFSDVSQIVRNGDLVNNSYSDIDLDENTGESDRFDIVTASIYQLAEGKCVIYELNLVIELHEIIGALMNFLQSVASSKRTSSVKRLYNCISERRII